MGFAVDIFACLKKTTDFRGRSRRREFWAFVAFWVVVAVGCALVKSLAVLALTAALAVPLAAVAVRRLHDIGLSGWWLVSAAAPVPVLDLLIVGAQVVCFAKQGTAGPNRYGPDPRC